MKSLNCYLIYCCLGAIVLSCSKQQSPDPKAENSFKAYSETYKNPVFEADDRIEKIKSIAPEIQNLIEIHAKAENIPGIAFGIVADDQLVISDATGLINIGLGSPATPLSSFRIASMTKSFTAMAIMKLKEDGKLALSDPVSKYIPEMATLEYLTNDAPIIDIESLLTMTAGFPEDNAWGDRQLDEPDQMLKNLLSEGVSFSNVPSYEFEYSNTGYALLGNIISRISGIPYQDYISMNLFEPLGMHQTYWEYDSVPSGQLAMGYRWEDEQWKLEPMLHDGAYGAMGGLITSIEDFSKYVSFNLSAWPPRSDEDNGPIKRHSLREMQTPQYSTLYANEMDFNGDPCANISGYGFGLGITTFCNNLKEVGHGGALPGFGSNYRFYPEYGIGIMAFCNLTYTSPWPYRSIGKLLFETLALAPRQLPVSTILRKRQAQIVQLIQHWDNELEAEILAENFYLDKSREERLKKINNVLDKAGSIGNSVAFEPMNQLRGTFTLQAEKGIIRIFFSLTPEKKAKVQQLDIAFEPNE
ncbi:serine hydrolase [uncultured Cyclobacterium sp.]|uniref:serine hydrolase domain-containing protein n=1 Tax=uncultured Cyclobacterium sp. TaxID=453820 RepID=UPI0030EBA9EE|tara:strand:+ start:88192 stop:89775 length:1584 start_codon:yes stop_codon:yes gene_type:complete